MVVLVGGVVVAVVPAADPEADGGVGVAEMVTVAGPAGALDEQPAAPMASAAVKRTPSGRICPTFAGVPVRDSMVGGGG